MDFGELKKRIVEELEKIKGADLNKLNPEGATVQTWDEKNPEEISKFIKETYWILMQLQENPALLEVAPKNTLEELYSRLNRFREQYDELQKIKSDQILDNQHHGALNHINAVNKILRSSGIYSEIKLAPQATEIVQKIKEANNQLKNFDKNKFSQASDLVDELIEKKISFEEKAIKENLGTFIKRANEHKISHYNLKTRFFDRSKMISFSGLFQGKMWWLILAFIMGLILAYSIHLFIQVLGQDNQISLGASVLRISSLLVPSYFLIFSINQFLYHKRMYEIYSFKNTSLNTMTDLMKVNKDKADKILDKGLDVLFAEPNLKEDKKYDRQLVSELITMLKNQINR